MTTTVSNAAPPAHGELPHWETIPSDIPAATAEIKAALRDRIAASGRTVTEVFAELEAFIADEVADIHATRERGEDVWPVIDFADVAAGTVSEEQLDRKSVV